MTPHPVTLSEAKGLPPLAPAGGDSSAHAQNDNMWPRDRYAASRLVMTKRVLWFC